MGRVKIRETAVAYYPIYLDLTDKPCVIVGGGEVSQRKAMRLMECGARVMVVSRDTTPDLAALVKAGRITHLVADYHEGHIQGAFLVIGATDRPEVNERIARDCRWLGIMVNIVDDPEHCDFIIPSVLQQGDLSIAISTGGKSPALARALREELETHYGPEYAVLLKIMGQLREKIIARGKSSGENRHLFENVVQSEILQFIRERQWERVRQLIFDLTGEEITVGA